MLGHSGIMQVTVFQRKIIGLPVNAKGTPVFMCTVSYQEAGFTARVYIISYVFVV